jgi:AcrR family transcriptional regulator
VAARRSKRGDPAFSDLGPLPGGHHGLSREQVAESQRERLLAGLAHAVAAHGYKATTITEIVRAASVSSRDFYESFDSKEACFLAAFDAVVGHLRELIAAAAEPVPDWPGRVVAALRTALDFFAAEPDLARLCLVEPFTASPAIATHFRGLVVATIPYLRPGRAERPEAAALPESTEDSLLGGLIALTARSILAADDESLQRLLPDLVDFALSPYLGPARAKQLAAEAASSLS